VLLATALGMLAVAPQAGAVPTRASGSTPAGGTYGQIPSWLPKAKVPVGRVVVASAAHPRLAIQGDTVSAELAQGRVLVTAVGPSVPEEGQFPVPPTSPCTFLVTFTAPSGAVPLKPSAFTILDELGHLHHPKVTSPSGAAPTPSARPGRTVTLRIDAVLPTGNGQLRWSPGGRAPLVSWDFDVEID
jgi:hypothetical protein